MKYRTLLMVIALGSSFTYNHAVARSEEMHYVMKTIKILWHIGEIWSGYKVGQLCAKENSLKKQVPYGIGSVSLIYHGFAGLDKELKLLKRLQEIVK